MKFIITPNSFENAIKLINNNAHALLLSLNKFSCRSNYYFSLEQIKQICESKKNTKIFIKLNNFIFENQINDLENNLIILSKINIDKLFFNDFAIPQIIFEKKLSFRLHYHPDTLVTSFGQFDFFNENNIFSLTLSNELFKHEIKDILKNKNRTSICIQGHGYSFIMHSRWELITNFQKYANDLNNEYTKDKMIFIREHKKKYPNIIIEDEYGTHMLSGYKLCLLQYLKELEDFELDYLILDTYLETEPNYDIKINEIYNKTKNDNNFNDYFKYPNYSSGFYGGINSILHFQKIGDKNEK